MSHTEERVRRSLFGTLKKESSTSTSPCSLPSATSGGPLIKSKMNGNSASPPMGELVSEPPII